MVFDRTQPLHSAADQPDKAGGLRATSKQRSKNRTKSRDAFTVRHQLNAATTRRPFCVKTGAACSSPNNFVANSPLRGSTTTAPPDN